MMAVGAGQDQLASFVQRAPKMSRAEAEGLADELFGASTDACKEALSLYERVQQIERDKLSPEPGYDERNKELSDAGYELLSKIGQGGGGSVYRAKQQRTGQLVAVKMLARRFGPAAAGHLKREISHLTTLRHPNFVHLYDAGITTKGRPFFVMEYIDGTDLVKHCHDKGKTLTQRIVLMAQVCDCVAELHRQGVIHRDLKPQNILVTHNGHPKVLDFGLAQATWPDPVDAAVARLTSEPTRSPYYAAPEQDDIRYRAETGCDCYALGRILYKLLTGELTDKRQPVPPSQAKMPPEHVNKLGCRDGAELRRKLAGDLDAIVLKALAADPGLRYRDATSIAADLRALLAHLPVSAVPQTRAYVGRLFVRRNPWWVGLTGIFLVLLFCSTILALVAGARERIAKEEAFHALQQANRSRKDALTSAKKADTERESAQRELRGFRDAMDALKASVVRASEVVGESSRKRLEREVGLWSALEQSARDRGYEPKVKAAIFYNAALAMLQLDSTHGKGKRLLDEVKSLGVSDYRSLRSSPGLWSLQENVVMATLAISIRSAPPQNLELIRSLARANLPDLRSDQQAWAALKGSVCGIGMDQVELRSRVPELKEICQ